MSRRRPLGITASQAEALQLLDMYGPMSLGELGALLIAECGHPSRLVDRMVPAGLVTRRSAADDWRRVDLLPTERGRELAALARESKQGFRSWVAEQIEGVDLAPVRSFFVAFLDGTELGDTVHRGRDSVPHTARRP